MSDTVAEMVVIVGEESEGSTGRMNFCSRCFENPPTYHIASPGLGPSHRGPLATGVISLSRLF